MKNGWGRSSRTSATITQKTTSTSNALTCCSMLQLNRHTANQPLTLPVKILQFGEGNFLRAFVDWIVDIMNEKTDFYGAIDIVQPISRGMTAQLREQDGLYHVVLNGLQQGRTVSETRLITCVAD